MFEVLKNFSPRRDSNPRFGLCIGGDANQSRLKRNVDSPLGKRLTSNLVAELGKRPREMYSFGIGELLNLFSLAIQSWGRCYDHNFWPFLLIFGKKNWRFSQKPMLCFKCSTI
jgi:hypothetical protein